MTIYTVGWNSNRSDWPAEDGTQFRRFRRLAEARDFVREIEAQHLGGPYGGPVELREERGVPARLARRWGLA